MAKLKHFLQDIILVFTEQEERFILWVPVFIAFGIGAYFSLPFEPSLWSSMTVLMIVAVMLSITRNVILLTKVEFVVFLILLGFTVASFRAYTVNYPMLEKRLGPTLVSGSVLKMENLPEKKGVRLILSDLAIEKISKSDTPKKIRVQVYNKAVDKNLQIGDTVSLLAILNAPSSPVIAGGFDFRRYMFFKQIGATGFAVGDVKVILKVADRGYSRAFHKFWEDLRQEIKLKIHKLVPDNNVVSALMVALLTGDRGEIDKNTWEDIRNAGLAHLLAISGLHMGLVAGLIFFVVRAILALSETVALNFSIKKISAAIAMLTTIFYLFLVGAPVSAQRATIMTSIVLLAVILDREGISMRLAAIAATVILLITPEALLSAGFQMSFAAVISLIAFYEALSPIWRGWYENSNILHRGMLYLFGTILTTIIASLATAAFSLYHFGKVADHMSLLANILAVPVTSFIVMPAGIMSLALMPIGYEEYSIKVMAAAVEFIYSVAHDLSSSGEHVIYTPTWQLSTLIFIVLGGLWLAIWRGRLRLFGFILILFGIALAVVNSHKLQPDIFIADRGKLVAVRMDETKLVISSLKKGKFISENWIKFVGKNKIEAIEWPKDGRLRKNFVCDWQNCNWYKANKRFIFVINPITFVKNCNSGNFAIISANNDIPKHCNIWFGIDSFDLWRYGAHSIFFDKNIDKIVIKTVAGTIGNRYWTPKRFKGL